VSTVAPSGASIGVGIDGCRAGWIAVALHADGRFEWLLDEAVAAIVARWPRSRCLIDIPIGLPERSPRAVEREARRLLGRPRSSSVFPVPSRAAVYASDYAEACARNREVLGCAVSRQAWNITPKIREVDALLRERPGLDARLLEAHPELCLRALAGGVAMSNNKKTPAGQAERRALLRRVLPTADAVLAAIERATRRADVARDDAVDALALAVSSRLPLVRITGADGAREDVAAMVFPRQPPHG
jgi:predicted RNase H-like nuclease